MRKTRVFFALALVVLGVARGQAVKDPVDSNPVVVSSHAKVVASLAQSTVRIGDPIILHFHLKNVSSGVIGPLMYNEFADDYWLMVTDASGAELQRTKEGDRLRQRSTVVASTMGFLNPGAEEHDQVIDVSRLYQLDRPGNYFVRIARRIGPSDHAEPRLRSGDGRVVSQIPIEEAVSDLIPFTIIP